MESAHNQFGGTNSNTDDVNNLDTTTIGNVEPLEIRKSGHPLGDGVDDGQTTGIAHQGITDDSDSQQAARVISSLAEQGTIEPLSPGDQIAASTSSLNNSHDEFDSDEDESKINIDPNAGEHFLFQHHVDARRKSLATDLGVKISSTDEMALQKLIEEVKRLYTDLALAQLAKAFEDLDTKPPTEDELNQKIRNNGQFKQSVKAYSDFLDNLKKKGTRVDFVNIDEILKERVERQKIRIAVTKQPKFVQVVDIHKTKPKKRRAKKERQLVGEEDVVEKADVKSSKAPKGGRQWRKIANLMQWSAKPAGEVGMALEVSPKLTLMHNPAKFVTGVQPEPDMPMQLKVKSKVAEELIQKSAPLPQFESKLKSNEIAMIPDQYVQSKRLSMRNYIQRESHVREMQTQTTPGLLHMSSIQAIDNFPSSERLSISSKSSSTLSLLPPATIVEQTRPRSKRVTKPTLKLELLQRKLHRAIIESMNVKHHESDEESREVQNINTTNCVRIQNIRLRAKRYARPKYAIDETHLLPRFKNASPASFELLSKAKFGDRGMQRPDLDEFGIRNLGVLRPFLLPKLLLPDSRLEVVFR